MSTVERVHGVTPLHPDYSRWTIEELRRFAQQLRVRDASRKNRRELVELFDTSPSTHS